MFWRFGNQNVATLDTKLDEPGCTLETILNEEDLLQEVKTRNVKLINFLCTPEILKELVTLVVKLDSPPVPEREGSGSLSLEETRDEEIMQAAKFSFLATEVFCCDVVEIIDAVLRDTTLLDILWDILDRPVPLDPMHANNFARIMGMLIATCTDYMFDYIQGRAGVVDKILTHLENSGIVDLLLRLMTSDDFHETDDIAKWLREESVIKKIISRLDPNLDEQLHGIASLALMDMVAAYHHAHNPDPQLLNNNVLIMELKSEASVEQLTSFMLTEKSPKASSVIINGINILIELLRRGTCSEDYDIVPQMPEGGELSNLPPPPPPIHRDALDISELVKVLTAKIPQFKEAITNPRKSPTIMQTSFGPQSPLGAERLTITELFAELLRVQTAEVFQKFLEHNIFSICFDLFFLFPWNNLLHMVVCDMVNTVFDSNFSIAKDLIHSIFFQGKLTTRILYATRQNSHETEKARGVRMGYMGHITLLTDKILLLIERRSEDGVKLIYDEFLQSEEWQEYETKHHRETKERDSKPLGGHKPTMSLTSGEDDVPFSMHVDVNTDQLARFMIHQVVKDLPGGFAIDFGEEEIEDEPWTSFQDSTFDVKAGSATEPDPKESEEEDTDDEDFDKSSGEGPSNLKSGQVGVSFETATAEMAGFKSPTLNEDPFAALDQQQPQQASSEPISADNWADFSKMSINEAQLPAGLEPPTLASEQVLKE